MSSALAERRAVQHNLPLQNEGRVGLAVAGVVHVNCVATVGSKLAQSALAAAHPLRQATAAARHAQSERSVVHMTHHEGVGAGNVAWRRRDVS